jgi:hypothetical protein
VTVEAKRVYGMCICAPQVLGAMVSEEAGAKEGGIDGFIRCGRARRCQGSSTRTAPLIQALLAPTAVGRRRFGYGGPYPAAEGRRGFPGPVNPFTAKAAEQTSAALAPALAPKALSGAAVRGGACVKWCFCICNLYITAR